MLSDDQRLLVGMCRIYLKLQGLFGQPGQPTFMQFPSIQGSAMRHAVERIAAIPARMTDIAVARVADEMTRDNEDNEPPDTPTHGPAPRSIPTAGTSPVAGQ